MKHHCCPASRSGITIRRATGLAGVVLSGIPLLLMPKCPLCVAAYVTLFTGISISTASAGRLRTGIIASCAILLTGLVVMLLMRTRGGREQEG